MGTEKTPLVQKLILGVLTLILMCLVVLIAQNRSRERRQAALANAAGEPSAEAQPEQAATGPADRPVRFVPVAVRSQSEASPVTSEPEAKPAATAPPQIVTPQAAQTALVNPVGRAPVEIVVRPDGQVLKTELCGRVRLEGKAPPEVPIKMDAACSRLQDGSVTTRHYLVGPDGGLANVLVYISHGLPFTYSPPPINAPTVTVSRCLYAPYVVGIQAGQKITFVNADNVLHNVHATSRNNQEFNLALTRGGQTAQRLLEKPDIFVRLKCDVHPWEFSYVGVISHPFFAITDTNGVFCLPAGLPHGRYVLAAAHPKAGETLQEIVIQDENPNPIELAFTVKR